MTPARAFVLLLLASCSTAPEPKPSAQIESEPKLVTRWPRTTPELKLVRYEERFVAAAAGRGCPDLNDDTICWARGSGGGGTFKSPTWCAYECKGVDAPIEIELPPGMTRCPGEAMGKVKFKQLKDFPPSRRSRTPRPGK